MTDPFDAMVVGSPWAANSDPAASVRIEFFEAQTGPLRVVFSQADGRQFHMLPDEFMSLYRPIGGAQ